MNSHYTQLPNLRGMSVAAAMRLAIAYSGKPDAEIAAVMGWSASVASRVFSNGDYWPSLPSLPLFYAAVGNVTLFRAGSWRTWMF